jgi:hypothetical protein
MMKLFVVGLVKKTTFVDFSSEDEILFLQRFSKILASKIPTKIITLN